MDSAGLELLEAWREELKLTGAKMVTAAEAGQWELVSELDRRIATALQKLQQGGFEFVVTDWNMPNMDGISFVKAVKQLPAYTFTPVIMLTTESEAEKMKQGQAAGAKAWVVKPFQPAQMLAAVGKLVMA